jgi:putative ABC transport system ATP-binding protein
MLEVRNAVKVFGAGTVDENRVLDGFSLHLDAGEFVTIIGSNGAGKSTLFNAIAGSITLDSGSVTLDGADITHEREHRRARLIGRLFQDPRTGTAPVLTIEENLALVHSKASGEFALSRALRAGNRAFFRDLLARLDMGLEDRLKTPVGLLSGGQRQALTLLLATMVPPRLLLLDEHTAALDPVSAKKILSLTGEIVGTHGIATLMITHNISSALELGTRTVMMHKGRIVMDLRGQERAGLSTGDLLVRYNDAVREVLDTDRVVL